MPWGLGGGGWGIGPWGAGFLSLTSARAVAENRVRATFDLPLNLSGLLVLGDALRPQNYLVTPGSGARAVAVVACEEVSGDDSSVDLVVDRPLSSSPLRYALRALNVLSELGLPLDPSASSAEFPGLLDKRVPREPDTLGSSKDFASPQTRADTLDPLPGVVPATLGSLPIDDTGDYAFDEGIANLRKRVLRRCVTRRGGFYHLPRYGLGIPYLLKRNAIPALLRRLQDDAREQIGSEPDLQGVEVAVTLERRERGAYLRVRVKGRQRGKEFTFNPAFRLAA